MAEILSDYQNANGVEANSNENVQSASPINIPTTGKLWADKTILTIALIAICIVGYKFFGDKLNG